MERDDWPPGRPIRYFPESKGDSMRTRILSHVRDHDKTARDRDRLVAQPSLSAEGDGEMTQSDAVIASLVYTSLLGLSSRKLPCFVV